jgi:hypothetical protein
MYRSQLARDWTSRLGLGVTGARTFKVICAARHCGDSSVAFPAACLFPLDKHWYAVRSVRACRPVSSARGCNTPAHSAPAKIRRPRVTVLRVHHHRLSSFCKVTNGKLAPALPVAIGRGTLRKQGVICLGRVRQTGLARASVRYQSTRSFVADPFPGRHCPPRSQSGGRELRE